LPINLDEGEKQVVFTAQDAAGHTGVFSTTLLVDDTPPSVQVTGISESSPWAYASGATVYYGDGAGSAVQRHDYDFDATDTFSGDAAIVVTDRAGNEGTATFTVIRDVGAPQVSLEAISNGNTITVTWNATDPGSGVAGYELDVRVDGGDWETLLNDVQETSYAYPADYAHGYAFRVTATDNVGNVGQGEASASTGSAVTKYYYLGGQRVAMRGPDNAVVWLHGDHLSSTSLATDGDGDQVSRQLYYPFGEVRWASAEMPTDFAGQRLDGYVSPEIGS
ncbi:MAG: hypothetical protein PVF45_06930, partial [Anaerolineae bacterium]